MNSTNFIDRNHESICRIIQRQLGSLGFIDSWCSIQAFNYDTQTKTLTGKLHFKKGELKLGDLGKNYTITYENKDVTNKKAFEDRLNLDLAALYIRDIELRHPQSNYKFFFWEHHVDHILITATYAAGGESLFEVDCNAEKVRKIYDFATGRLDLAEIDYLIEDEVAKEQCTEAKRKPDYFLQMPFIQFTNLN